MERTPAADLLWAISVARMIAVDGCKAHPMNSREYLFHILKIFNSVGNNFALTADELDVIRVNIDKTNKED